MLTDDELIEMIGNSLHDLKRKQHLQQYVNSNHFDPISSVVDIVTSAAERPVKVQFDELKQNQEEIDKALKILCENRA